jgi:hypothetical protein
MSDTTEPPVDFRAIVARIDRDLEEAGKLREESQKFIAEQKKLMAEEAKLRSEARKLDRDRWIASWLAITGLVGGLITVGGALWRVLH